MKEAIRQRHGARRGAFAGFWIGVVATIGLATAGSVVPAGLTKASAPTAAVKPLEALAEIKLESALAKPGMVWSRLDGEQVAARRAAHNGAPVLPARAIRGGSSYVARAEAELMAAAAARP